MKKLTNIQKNKVIAGFGIGTIFSAMSPYLKTFFISSAANIGIGFLSNILNIASSSIFTSNYKNNTNSYNYIQKENKTIKNAEFKTPILNFY